MTQPAGTLLTAPARLRRLVVRILAMLVMVVVAGQTVRDATRVKTESRRGRRLLAAPFYDRPPSRTRRSR